MFGVLCASHRLAAFRQAHELLGDAHPCNEGSMLRVSATVVGRRMYDRESMSMRMHNEAAARSRLRGLCRSGHELPQLRQKARRLGDERWARVCGDDVLLYVSAV